MLYIYRLAETTDGKSFAVELNVPFDFAQEKGVSTLNQNKVIWLCLQ